MQKSREINQKEALITACNIEEFIKNVGRTVASKLNFDPSWTAHCDETTLTENSLICDIHFSGPHSAEEDEYVDVPVRYLDFQSLAFDVDGWFKHYNIELELKEKAIAERSKLESLNHLDRMIKIYIKVLKENGYEVSKNGERF